LWIQGIELPVKELDSLMHLLSEKKRKVEQEEAETNMEILLEFLTRSRQQKQEELNQVRRMQIVRIWWKL
jgi:E3 ubiquitin-protein ligase RFWD2